QSAIFTPLGTTMKAMRRGAPALVAPPAARETPGAIDSNSGSAMAVPKPLRNVRRGICHCAYMRSIDETRRIMLQPKYDALVGAEGGSNFKSESSVAPSQLRTNLEMFGWILLAGVAS